VKHALSLLLAVHGAIHLLGFVKGFELAPVIPLKQPISRATGALWLLAALLLFASAALLHAAPGRWWLAAVPAVVLSQALVLGAWTDARFGTVANAILLVPLAVALLQRAPWSLRAEFDRAVAARPPAAVAGPSDAVTAADLAHLPATVRRHVERAGAVGRPHVRGFEARFTGRLRNGVGSPWMEIEAEQRTTLEPPARLFFVTAARAGVPFHAFHQLTPEGATMRVRVAGLAQVVDARGPEMDRSEAVTFFNDLCVLAPGALVDAPVRWEELDPRTVRGTFTLGRETVSATLAFDEAGDLVGFTSQDRSMSADGKTFERHPWSTPLRDHAVFGDVRVARRGAAAWSLPTGEFTYGEFFLESLRTHPAPAPASARGR
jgi:hypothetical protein